MKPPRAIDILGKRWRIRARQSKKDLGLCDHDTLTIYYSPKQPMDELRDTIWHEVTHAVSDQMTLNLSEKQVAGTATLQLHALRGNPDLAAFLLGK